MSLPPNSPFRGVAAAIRQPASPEDICELSGYIDGLEQNNRPRIQFRNPYNDQEVIEAVYRWDLRHYTEIFGTGFAPWPRSSTQREADYYNLEQFVNGGGKPTDTSPSPRSVFVSTTRSTRWRPPVTENCTLYRYRIFAPGGIDAVLTLGDINNFPNQQEISFAGGITTDYIETAIAYSVTVAPGSHFTTYTPQLDSATGQRRIYRNFHFNPNPNPDGWTPVEFMGRLRQPTCRKGEKCMVKLVKVPRAGRRDAEDTPHVEKRDAEDTPHVEKRDAEDDDKKIWEREYYIESAFNFYGKKEQKAYLFIGDQCLLINYAPATTDDKIIKGPLSIDDCFPYLKDTIFATGIDAAFTSSKENEAYIFRSNIYALINFAADGGKIIQGPKRIIDSFHSLKNTIFENGIDAAFTSPGNYWFSPNSEAYIFKGDQYALINFAPGTTNDRIIQGPKKITLGFPSLKGPIFEDGLDAAFSSSKLNEAYIFKGDTYALINYAPGTTDDYIVNGPITPISEGFHSLKDIIPMYTCGC